MYPSATSDAVKKLFLSTPSARRATLTSWASSSPTAKFLSTPSARRATRAGAQRRRPYSNFYPRPPRGGRPEPRQQQPRPVPISIHALREEGDLHSLLRFGAAKVFLSTPSARRATPCTLHLRSAATNFYPRPPRGGRRAGIAPCGHCSEYFYPRPPRGGRQPHHWQVHHVQKIFLSTPSARRATRTGATGCST